jgi:hypothetical protein
MRIQKGYESDSEAAKTQMEWVENFRKDIVARAYFDFLKSESSKTKWLMDLTGESRSNSAVVRPENVAQINTLTKPWHTAIYVLFHLSPADDISLLLHQFKKWSSLEGLKESDDGYDEIRDFQRLMSLYIDMHDDKQTGEGISRSFSDPFKEAFETDDDYKKIFITQGSDSDELGSTRRGLREILRFGHIKPLNSTLEKNRITSEDVTRLLSLEKLSSQNDKQSSPIAIAQKGRKELHKTITSGRRNASLEDSELYLEYLDTIEEHGNLARRVRFNDIIRLHRMMMRIASRLVDYAGTWERDGYFITLALMKLQGKTPCDIFMNNKAKDAFQDSKRWKWSSDLSDYKEDFGNLLHKFHSIDDHANQIRNNFAHFKYLSEDDVDLTNAVNDARCLLAYDRKLKNVVSKSIMDIVYQEGLLISWNMRTNGKRHDLVLDKIDSRMIKHLENKVPRNIAGKFKRSLHGNDYVAMVANIFR